MIEPSSLISYVNLYTCVYISYGRRTSYIYIIQLLLIMVSPISFFTLRYCVILKIKNVIKMIL